MQVSVTRLRLRAVISASVALQLGQESESVCGLFGIAVSYGETSSRELSANQQFTALGRVHPRPSPVGKNTVRAPKKHCTTQEKPPR